MIHGLTDVIIGARGVEAWRRFAHDVLGYRDVAEGTDDALGQGAPCAVFAPAGVDSGRLRVIAFPGAPDRDHPGPDQGYYDFDLYTRDMNAAVAAVARTHYPWAPAPGAWPIPGTPVTLTQGLIQGPDAVNVVPVLAGPQTSWLQAWQHEPAAPFSEVSSSIAIVPDMERSLGFWQGAFGMQLAGDFTLQDPFLDQLLRLDPGTTFRMCVLASPGATARVELIELPRAADRSNDSQPGTLGIIAWGFRSDDLDGDVDRVIGEGGKLEHVTAVVDDAAHGPARVAQLRSADNLLMELWQPTG